MTSSYSEAEAAFAALLSGGESDTAPKPAESEPVVQTDSDKLRHALGRFKIESAEDFAAGDIEDECHIQGVLPKAELVLIFGASGSGKTFVVTDLLAAVTRGEAWNGRAVERGRALYIAAESAGNYRKRLRAFQKSTGADWDALPDVLSVAPDLTDAGDAALLARAVLDHGGADVLCIDTLSASSPGADENAGKDMGSIVKHCRFIHEKTGATVVLVHHSGKDQSRGARGWSGLRAAADAELEIARNGDIRTATVTKMRDGEDGERWAFKLVPVHIGISRQGKAITSCVVEHVEGARHTATRQEPTGKYEPRVFDAVRNRLKSEPGGLPFADARSLGVTAIPHDVDDAKETARIRKGVERAIDALLTKRLLFFDNNRVSLMRARLVDDEHDWLGEDHDG